MAIDPSLCNHEELEGIGAMIFEDKLLELVNCTRCQDTYSMKDDSRFPSIKEYVPVRWHRSPQGDILFTYQRRKV